MLLLLLLLVMFPYDVVRFRMIEWLVFYQLPPFIKVLWCLKMSGTCLTGESNDRFQV